MEYINQKIHTINGIPAGNFGEWAGITSNKWRGSIKIIRPHTTDILHNGILFLVTKMKQSVLNHA